MNNQKKMRKRNWIIIFCFLFFVLGSGVFKYFALTLNLELKAYLLGILGAVVTCASFYLLWRHWVLMTKGVKTKGKVIALPVVGGGDWASFPVVKFNDLNGVSHTVRSKVSSSYGPRIGQQWDVCYDPDNPKDVIFGSLFLSWIVRMLLGCVGLGMLAFAWVWLKS